MDNHGGANGRIAVGIFVLVISVLWLPQVFLLGASLRAGGNRRDGVTSLETRPSFLCPLDDAAARAVRADEHEKTRCQEAHEREAGHEEGDEEEHGECAHKEATWDEIDAYDRDMKDENVPARRTTMDVARNDPARARKVKIPNAKSENPLLCVLVDVSDDRQRRRT